LCIQSSVRISFDPAKDRRNIQERGLSFGQVIDFEFENALVEVDSRKEYGETRLVCFKGACMCCALLKLPMESASSAFAKRMIER
jgi:hypothetical protein